MPTDGFFWVFAALAVLTGWRVFRTDSMVRASFYLLTSFLAVAGILLLLTAPYLGFALMFMMAVEMMVMALFMVMFMMNPAGLNPMSMVHQPRTALAAGVGVGGILGAVALGVPFLRSAAAAPPDPIAALGTEILGGSMLVFESAGVTLLAAMIGTVVLSSRRGRYGDADHGSRPPGLEPGGEPGGRRPAHAGEGPMAHAGPMRHGGQGDEGHAGREGHGGHEAHGRHGGLP